MQMWAASVYANVRGVVQMWRGPSVDIQGTVVQREISEKLTGPDLSEKKRLFYGHKSD